jgi:hypothetical protein
VGLADKIPWDELAGIYIRRFNIKATGCPPLNLGLLTEFRDRLGDELIAKMNEPFLIIQALTGS